MKEHFLSSSVRRERDYVRQYEYLVLTVSPEDSLPEARRLLVEHSEYGKWELERSVLYLGGGRRFWLRRQAQRRALSATAITRRTTSTGATGRAVCPFVPTTRSMEVHDQKQPGDADLIEVAATETLRRDGHVFPLTSDNGVSTAAAEALLRF